MPKSLHYCLILITALFSESSSGTEPIVKYVCQGDYVQMFENVTLVQDKPVNLYINGKDQEVISTWYLNQSSSVLSGRETKVLFDKYDTYGTILIRNIQLADEAKYVLSYGNDDPTMKSAVQILVMVPPTKYCKQMIQKMDIFSTAFLEASDCGRPQAFVHWLVYPHTFIIGKDVVNLPSEHEAGTYYACALSPALQCVKNLTLSDYCIPFPGQRNNRPPVSSEISDMTTITIVTVILVSIIAVYVVIAAIIPILRKVYRKKKRSAVATEDSQKKRSAVATEDSQKKRSAVATEGESMPLIVGAPRGYSARHLRCVHWCIRGQESDAEEVNNEDQPRLEVPEPVRCKICNNKKMKMHYLFCDHIAKLYNMRSYMPVCASCKNSLPQCEECKPINKKKTSEDMFWGNI